MTYHFRLYRRSIVDTIGGIDVNIAYAPDYDLCLRLSEATEIHHLAEPLYFYRLHRQSMSAESRLQQIMSSEAAIKRALDRRGLSDTYELEVEIQGKFTLREKGADGTRATKPE